MGLASGFKCTKNGGCRASSSRPSFVLNMFQNVLHDISATAVQAGIGDGRILISVLGFTAAVLQTGVSSVPIAEEHCLGSSSCVRVLLLLPLEVQKLRKGRRRNGAIRGGPNLGVVQKSWQFACPLARLSLESAVAYRKASLAIRLGKRGTPLFVAATVQLTL